MKNDNICTYFVLSFMLSFDVIIFQGKQMLSFLCYHFPLYIFCVIINVIIWCYHLLLSFPPFFLFPENVTHSPFNEPQKTGTCRAWTCSLANIQYSMWGKLSSVHMWGYAKMFTQMQGSHLAAQQWPRFSP